MEIRNEKILPGIITPDSIVYYGFMRQSWKQE